MHKELRAVSQLEKKKKNINRAKLACKEFLNREPGEQCKIVAVPPR